MPLQIHRADIVQALPEYRPPPVVRQSDSTAKTPRVEEDDSARRSSTGPGYEGAASYEEVEHGPTEYRPALTAADIMSADPVCLRQDATVEHVRDLFHRHGFKHLPVLDRAGRVVGVLAERDLLRRAGQSAIEIGQLVGAEVITATADTPIRSIAAAMLAHHIGCLPIVDGEARPVGILTRSDILRALVNHGPLELWV